VLLLKGRTLPKREHFAATLRLAVPVVIVEIGLMAMGSVDTMFVGRVSANALGAIAIGNAYFWVVFILGMGILFGLDPLITQAVGAHDRPAIAVAVQRGFLLSVVLGLFSSLLLVPGEAVLTLLRQPPEIIPVAAQFVRASIGGIIPLYAFVVVRILLQAHDSVAPLVISIVIANVVNIVLNYMLVFGNLGAPELGPVGSGWANTFSRWVLFIAVLAISWKAIAREIFPFLREALALRPLWRILMIGVPIAIQYELEVNAFAVVAIMMGWIGATAMAAHQISINIAAMTFMVPLGISAAAAVHVGRSVGAGDPLAVKRYAGAALVVGVAFMTLSACVMLAAPRMLARVYTPEETVLATAALLLPLAGLFQVFDGIQVVSVGILRGTGDTKTPAVINVLGFWLVGVPVSAWLGFKTGMGPRGLWIGFIFGLGAVAIMLLARVRARLRQDLRRTIVDTSPAATAGATATR
jgi:multidrug resistance protein, MATE family